MLPNPMSRAMMGETTRTHATSEAHPMGIDGGLRHRGLPCWWECWPCEGS